MPYVFCSLLSAAAIAVPAGIVSMIPILEP
jgi:hypothetical protein